MSLGIIMLKIYIFLGTYGWHQHCLFLRRWTISTSGNHHDDNSFYLNKNQGFRSIVPPRR
jgi:hypothetical protein